MKRLITLSSLLLLLIGGSFLISCEKELKYDKSIMDPKLVVQGILEIDSPFVIYLERTYSFTENNPNTAITGGAVITVTNVNTGQTFTQSVPVDSNRYEFPFNTAANTEYQITVTHPDYPTVTATTRTTNVVPLISVDTATITNGYPLMEATLKWQDPPGQNYYMVRVFATVTDEFGYVFQSSGGAYSTDPVVASNSTDDPLSGQNWVSYFLFSDEQFENSLKSFKIVSNHPFYNWTNPPYEVTAKYHLISINYDTYLYYKSRLIQENSDPMFAEPSKIFTNVTNGYGIFGSVSGSTVTFTN